MKPNPFPRSVVAVAAVAIAILAAYANAGSAESIAQTRPQLGGPSAFGSAGNPTPLGNLQPRHEVSDLTIDTGLGPFTFRRSFSNSNDHWAYYSQGSAPSLLGEPFGRSPKDAREGGAAHSMLWWHNLYSSVRYMRIVCTGGGTEYVCSEPHFLVRDLGGAVLEFDPALWGCDEYGNGCVMMQAEGVLGYRLEKTSAGYTLSLPDGRRHHFESAANATELFHHYFLTRIEAPRLPATGGAEPEPRPFLELRYAAPAGCNGTFDGTAEGVPYLSEVANFLDAGGWQGSKLTFQYGLAPNSRTPTQPECVLVRVAEVPASSGVEEQFVRYSYLGADAGLLASAYAWPSEAIETYGYGDSVRPLWQIERRQDGGTPVWITLKALADAGNGVEGYGGYVLVDEDQDNRWLVTAENPDASIADCPPGRIGAPCSPYQQQIFTSSPSSSDHYRFSGDGTRTQSQVEQRFQVSAGLGTQTGKATRKCLAGCPAPIGSTPQTDEWVLGTGGHPIDVLDWSRDRVGTYTDYVHVLRDGGDGDTELRAVYAGASSSTGANALTQRHYEYRYADAQLGAQQQIKKTWAPTVVAGASGSAGVEYTYDRGNRVTAEIAFGKSVDINGVVSDRYIGTFYTYGPPPLGQLLAVDGPCLTTSTTATGCSESPFPHKEFEYYSIGLGTANAGKLRYERVYPNGPSSMPLTVEYRTYDSQGRVLDESDSNGAFTCRDYENDLLASVRSGADAGCAGGELTKYSYDPDGRLKSVLAPSGQHELYCYRKNADASCAGGTLTSRIQWKGRGSTDSYSAVKEKIEFVYSAGALVQETTKDATGAVRSIRRYEADPFGRPSFDGWGDPMRAGSFSNTRRFDSADRVTDVGLAYNNPSPFCGTGQNCAKLERDRLGRLTSLTNYNPVGKTCYKYDAAGNLLQTASGYAFTDSCAEIDVTLAVSSYQYDDFGNMVFMTGPWASPARFEYDARGNLTRKKSPAMGPASLVYTYDLLGRVVNATSDPQVLFSYDYDNEGGTAPSGCETTNTLGRVRRQLDSFGATWFSYDSLGRLVAEKRSRTPTGPCTGGTPNDNPSGATEYYPGGRVKTVTYPHGRVVTYGYATDLPERLTTISSNAPGQPSVTLISGIHWEPYGGLSGYVAGTTPASRVEYLQGDNGQVTPGAFCSMGRPEEVSSDKTGRLRGLWVSTDGGTIGDVYKRVYTWKADQIAQEDTCLLNELRQTVKYSPDGVSPGYDKTLQLTSVSRPAGEHQSATGRGGAVGRRDYVYDDRGNRGPDVHDCYNFSTSYSAGSDRLLSRTSASTPSWCGKEPTAYGVGFTYDQDGRAVTRSSPMGNGYSGRRNLIEFDWSLGAGATAATGSVFRSARINGLVYEYFYDAQGRRRVKDHPIGDKDEYFYLGGSLIEDRGVPDDFAPTNEFHPLDEYIWLAGRPVVMVRTLLDGAWDRTASTDCTRNQEYAACGTFFIVNDYLPKPVLMLDSTGKVAGVGDYDPFGHVNRVTVMGETSHPHAAQTNIALAHLSQPPLTKTDVQVRPKLALLDTESPSTGYVYLSSLDDSSFSSSCGGPQADGGVPEPCGNWATLLPDGKAKIRFKSTSNAGNAYQGAVLEGYEFRRNQKNATRAWTPIRLPGQYYDEETDLFENWNRFYDPSIGRYLSPDPILLSPGAVVGAAASGMSTPAYAYAGNNPVNFTDPTGLATQLVTWGGISANPWLDLDTMTAGNGLEGVVNALNGEGNVRARNQGQEYLIYGWMDIQTGIASVAPSAAVADIWNLSGVPLVIKPETAGAPPVVLQSGDIYWGLDHDGFITPDGRVYKTPAVGPLIQNQIVLPGFRTVYPDFSVGPWQAGWQSADFVQRYPDWLPYVPK